MLRLRALPSPLLLRVGTYMEGLIAGFRLAAKGRGYRVQLIQTINDLIQ